MATTNDLTTLVCLFHHPDQAQAAVRDLLEKGIAQSSVSTVNGNEENDSARDAVLRFGVPERDSNHLLESLRDGGVLVAVAAEAGQVSAVESVFSKHSAKLIDEVDTEDYGSAAVPAADEAAAIPIVQEELAVGKRTVDQGGVRVYRRVVEIPVDQEVTLHEEHVNVERHAVDRAVTDADLALQGEQTIELVETAEEVVVGKSARVVEEITVGKSMTERTQHIHDTVRHTEVDIEEVSPEIDPRTRL